MANLDITKYTRPRYVSSTKSIPLYVGILLTPRLSRDYNILTISNIDNSANFWEIYQSSDNGVTWTLLQSKAISEGLTYSLNPSNLNDGTYLYKVRIGSQQSVPDEVGNGEVQTYHDETFYSAYSSENISFIISTLNTPVVNMISGKSQFYFSVDSRESYLDVYVEEEISGVRETFRYTTVPTISNPLNLDYSNDNNSGLYHIYAISKSNGWSDQNNYYKNSITSNIKDYIVNKLETPLVDDSRFVSTPPTIFWNSIEDASGYKIYLNEILISLNWSGTSFDFSSYLSAEVESYKAYIKSTKANQGQYSNPYYLDSDKSIDTVFGTLPTPIITISDNIISISNFDKFNNADNFEIYNNGELWQVISSDNNSIALFSDEPKIFNVYFKATAKSDHISDSNNSNIITYRILRLNSPVISGNYIEANDTYYVSWNSIQNAEKYDIYIDSKFYISTNTTNVSIKLASGLRSIYVIATSSLYQYLDSNISNVLNYNKQARQSYYAIINNQEYKYELPFVFKKTLDESLDEGSLTLTPNNIKDPFEAYTDIEIYAKSENVLEDGSVEYNDIGREFPLHMLISQDDVEEINIGEESLYKHHINLIERTKLLETVLMPDFSITQPMEFTRRESLSTGEIKPELPDYVYPFRDTNRVLIAWFSESSGADSGTSTTRKIYLHGLNVPNNFFNIQSAYSQGDIIELPLISDVNVYLEIVETKQTWTRTGTQATTTTTIIKGEELGIKPVIEYKYRVDEGEYYQLTSNKFDTDNETLGNYTFSITINLSNNDWEKIQNKIISYKLRFGTYGTVNPYFLHREPSPDDSNVGQAGVRAFYNEWANYSEEFEISYRNVVLYRKQIIPASEYIPWESKSIYYAINKALKIAKPLEGQTKEKFSIDPHFKYLDHSYYGLDGSGNYILDEYNNKIKVNQYPCPELKFQNQKSLYEVLSEIGRLIHGIPRLGTYYNGVWNKDLITFDILDQQTIDKINESEYKNQETLEEIKSTLDNHASGYISNLSNVISDDYQYVYPSGSIWTKCKSDNINEPLANKDNMAIQVDKPIYRIVDVLVRGFNKNRLDEFVSIKNYVFEETNFNALSNSASGKGLAIYYKKGDNFIRGLGLLSEETLWLASLGLTSSDYIISKILCAKVPGLNLTDINNLANKLEYKVIYVPYNDLTVFTEQSNRSSIKNEIYRTLNQENNIISDVSFGRSAQIQIERLGNNSIEKNFISNVNSFVDLPKVGMIKEYDDFKYYADTVIYQINNNYISANVLFSKNFNKINDRIGIDSDYRLFRIYQDDYVDRSVNINKYVYISKNKESLSASTIQMQLILDIKSSFNVNGQSKPGYVPDSLYIRPFKNSNKDRLKYNSFEDGLIRDVTASILPLSCTRFDNSISLSGAFYDNFSAGIETSTVYMGTQRIQKDVRYVDTNGECQYLGFTIFNNNNETLTNSDIYPMANWNASPDKLNKNIYSQIINIDKDNRERIKFNYQLHFQTFDKYLNIHSGITRRLYQNNEFAAKKTSMSSPLYVLYTGDIKNQSNISGIDYQVVGTPSWTINADKTITISGLNITPDKNYNGFALIWPDGNIILSYSQNISSESNFTIPELYFNFSDTSVIK